MGKSYKKLLVSALFAFLVLQNVSCATGVDIAEFKRLKNIKTLFKKENNGYFNT